MPSYVVKRCQECKAIQGGCHETLSLVRCDVCGADHTWIFWIDLTGTAAASEFFQQKGFEAQEVSE